MVCPLHNVDASPRSSWKREAFCYTFCDPRHPNLLLPLSDAQSASEEYTTYACDGDLLRLECPSEADVIRVTRANYGR